MLGQDLLEAIKQQRGALASAIIAAIALIWVVHAPALPVAAGCFVALAYILFRSRARLLSKKKDS